MKLKNILLPLALTATLMACDEVDEADRFVQLPDVKSERSVLLEDYTGQYCTNCPEAHRLIASLQQQYGDALIVVAIHAGSFGILEGSIPALTGLMQPEGNDYAKQAGVESYPAGVLNRSSTPLRYTYWATNLRTELQKESVLNINLSASLDSENGQIVITSQCLPLADISGKLQLWVTESNIAALQVDNGKYLMDYVHNHVYRASVNGTWGEGVALKANVYSNYSHTIALRDNWNTDNLSVVAFVYDDANGVYQVAECEVE